MGIGGRAIRFWGRTKDDQMDEVKTLIKTIEHQVFCKYRYKAILIELEDIMQKLINRVYFLEHLDGRKGSEM